jgi:hypothetical protein
MVFFKILICLFAPAPHSLNKEIRYRPLSPLPLITMAIMKSCIFPQNQTTAPFLPAPPSLSPNTPLYPAFNRPFLLEMGIFPIRFLSFQIFLRGTIEKLSRRLPFFQGKHRTLPKLIPFWPIPNQPRTLILTESRNY